MFVLPLWYVHIILALLFLFIAGERQELLYFLQTLYVKNLI